jgi:hypothetical protein
VNARKGGPKMAHVESTFLFIFEFLIQMFGVLGM